MLIEPLACVDLCNLHLNHRDDRTKVYLRARDEKANGLIVISCIAWLSGGVIEERRRDEMVTSLIAFHLIDRS